jgi:hypothetical protein
MSHNKFGLKALGLCLLAALSVMAFAATGAQAKGEWKVNGVKLTTDIGVEALALEHSELLSTFGFNTKIQILCENVTVKDGLLFPDGSSLGELEFSKNCQTRTSLTLQENCKPLEPIVAKVRNLLIHHNGDTYIRFTPHDALTFATLHLGALCAAGTNIQVKGSAVAECGLLVGGVWSHEDCNVEKDEHEIREVPGTTLFPSDRLKFGQNPASLHGDIGLILNGAHAGGTWSGQALL